MKRKFLLTTALALCLCSCAGTIGPSVSHSGTGQEVVEGTLAENEVLNVYWGDTHYASYVLVNQTSYIYGEKKCLELKYVYDYNSLTIDYIDDDNKAFTYYYYGNDITIVVLKYNGIIIQPSEE